MMSPTEQQIISFINKIAPTTVCVDMVVRYVAGGQVPVIESQPLKGYPINCLYYIATTIIDRSAQQLLQLISSTDSNNQILAVLLSNILYHNGTGDNPQIVSIELLGENGMVLTIDQYDNIELPVVDCDVY